jgi:hypothetical protein
MRHLEDGEQECLMRWAELTPIPNSNLRVSDFLIAIPNGGRRNAREAKRLKMQGVKSGVSDLFLALPVASISGLWIEMKKSRKDFKTTGAANSAVRDSQREWIEKMKSVGYLGTVCYGADEAMAVIKTYLGLK